MSEQTLQSLLAERVTAFANSDKPVEIIDEHVKKMFTNVVDNCFGRYGDMGKQVEEAIKAALPANLTEIFELTRYNAMIAAALKEKWENSGVEADMVRLAQKQIDEVLNKDAMPEVISLQALLEAFVEDHKESAAEEHWEAPDSRASNTHRGCAARKSPGCCRRCWTSINRRHWSMPMPDSVSGCKRTVSV